MLFAGQLFIGKTQQININLLKWQKDSLRGLRKERTGRPIMSNFKNFKVSVAKQLKNMTAENNILFKTSVTKDSLWELYLTSFPEGTNEIFKERREHDCSCCKQFIRNAGNLVTIKNNKLVSVWDCQEDLEYPFNIVAEVLSELVKYQPIRDIFVSNEKRLGTDKTPQMQDNNKVKIWEHLYFELPRGLINNKTVSLERQKANARDSKNVFKRSMDELTLDAGQTILEIINQGSLYRGEEFKNVISAFIKSKKEYDNTPENEKDNWAWSKSANNPISRIRNTALGTLLVDLSKGVELDVAVIKFEKVMAPTNYKRPKAIFTKKMVEQAQAKIEELGYVNFLGRRFSTIDDITVNNVLFINRNIKRVGGDVFDSLKEDVYSNPKKFSKVEEVSIEDFINNMLPDVKSLEILVENKHQGNLMSLISPKDKYASSMFKWGNNFSWSYNGDIADSIKQNVAKMGGNITGVLRFSIQWNDKGDNENDLDAHCFEPNGNEIYFSNKGIVHPSSGMLDVDIINPYGKVAVENITWTTVNKMRAGKYKFFVHNYSHRGGRSGFTAEIEYDGQIYSYTYDKPLRQDENVVVAEINFDEFSGIKFIKSLATSITSREIWGVKTNRFAKVSSLILSPNYWDGNATGNKHYLFFLEGCKNESLPRGFYNEFLKEELLQHKRVFEALGSKMRVEESGNQLSGLGFSTTKRNSIIAKIEGSFKRVIKVNF